MIQANEGIVIIEEVAQKETTSESGIIITKPTNKGQPKGKIVSVGPVYEGQNTENGFVTTRLHYPPFKVGDTIIYKVNTGWEHEEDDKKYRILRFDDVLAVLKDSQ